MTAETPEQKKTALCELIEEKKNSLRNENQLLSAYSVDMAKTKEYNGRQLLELIQNAVDAGADDVLIRLRADNWLEIWDNGDSFKVEGIRSLLYPGRSPKKSGSFIGNKGLGFRSILNWADSIVIETEAGNIEFSRKLARDFFNVFPEDRRRYMLAQEGYSDDVIPVPVLGVPKYPSSFSVSEERPLDEGKVIRIQYLSDFKDDILRQMDEIDDRTLLFLDSLQRIRIDRGDGSETVHCRPDPPAISGNCKTVRIDKQEWQVYMQEGELSGVNRDPERKGVQKYSIAVALCVSDVSRNRPGPMYNYFRTNVHIPLPCTIHATMELNDSRDYLKPNYHSNTFIVQRIQELLADCAEKKVCAGLDPWMPFRLLTPVGGDIPCLGMEGFLKEKRQELQIIPTVDGAHVRWNEALVLDNDFAGFCQFQRIGIKNLVSEIPVGLGYAVPQDKYPLETLVEALNDCDLGNNSERLAQLIRQIWRVYPRAAEIRNKAHLLLNAKQELIRDGKTAYTPPTEDDKQIATPESIEIIDSNQYQQLLELFKEEIGGSNKARALSGQLSCFLNIEDYDRARINETIITETNRKLAETVEETKNESYVLEMVRKLYHNYIKPREDDSRYGGIVYLLNAKRELCQASDLLFAPDPCEEWPYTVEDYLLPIEQWNLTEEKEEGIEAKDLFKWLGVNEFVKVEIREGDGRGKYDAFLTSENIRGYNRDKIKKYSFLALKDFPFTEKPNVLVSMLARSRIVQKALSDSHKDSVVVEYYVDRTIGLRESYIHWQLKNWGEGNPFRGKMVSEVIEGCPDPSWMGVLTALGAHRDVDDMTEGELYSYLTRIGDNTSAPTGIQQIYSKILDALDKMDARPTDAPDFKLFVRGRNEPLPRSEVYYADNQIIPRFLRERFPIVNLPSRRGVNKVCERFGVQKLNDYVRLCEEDDHPAADAFGRYLQSRHRYLLAFRLFSEPVVHVEKDQEQEARRLRNARLRLVNRLTYTIGEEQDSNQLMDYEYIHVLDEGIDTYYLKTPEPLSLESLLHDSSFSDAVADVVAGVFSVGRLTDLFRSIIRNADEADLQHQLDNKFSQEQIRRVGELLGIKAEELFWDHFPGLKGWFRTDGVDYLDLSKPDGIRLLGEIAGSGEENKKKVLARFESDIRNWYDKKLINIKERYIKSFVFLRRNRLMDKDVEKQKLFMKDVSDFRGIGFDVITRKHEVVFSEDALMEVVRKYCKDTWDVDLYENCTESVDVVSDYRDLIDDPASLGTNVRGILYFPNRKEEVCKLMDAARQTDEDAVAKLSNAPSERIVFVKQIEMARNDYDPVQGIDHVYRHSDRQDRLNKQKGKVAQEKVRDSLINMGYEAEDISGHSWVAESGETYHADIRYRKKGSRDYRFLEVKYSTSGRFFMSAAELKTAQSEYRDIYDLAIYDGEKISVIEKLYKYIDNKRVVPHPSEYVVCFGDLQGSSE